MKVLLVDDHPLFLDGLKGLLTARGVQVVGTARDGLEALEQARTLCPEVILMDVQMPRCDGLTATRLIKAEIPEIQIVMLTMSNEDDHLFQAIKNGAAGYLLKSTDTNEFMESFFGLLEGQTPLSAGMARRILKEFGQQANQIASTPVNEPTEQLSARQTQVLTLVAQGLTYKQVGEALMLTERTVKYHMGEIVQRLHLRGRAEAVKYAKQIGLSDRSSGAR